MPYIVEERRAELDPMVHPETPGELNYCITMVVIDYLKSHKLSYGTINDIVGALDGAKMEFYRRVAIPYEDEKISTNGDVYE
jgi:hypothetical protein